MRGKNKRRGAHARPGAASKKLLRRSRPVFLIPVLLCCAIGLGFAVNGLWQQFPTAAVHRVVALHNVQIKGPFVVLTEQQLEETLLPYLQRSFFALDIAAIQQALLQNPWVSAAEVRRRWPGGLEITVEEARPLALWNRDQVLVASGKLLPRPAQLKVSGLPLLAGDTELTEQIMRQYKLLASLLAASDMEVKRLSFDGLTGWQLELASGLQLRLGHDELLARMQRFFTLAQGVLAPHLQKVVRVDTRYSNAVAVRWDDETTKRLIDSRQ